MKCLVQHTQQRRRNEVDIKAKIWQTLKLFENENVQIAYLGQLEECKKGPDVGILST